MIRSVPQLVRNKAVAIGATAWLEALPSVLADLEREWEVEVGDSFCDGTEAFVAAATLTTDGTPAVVKVMIPRPDRSETDEIRVLQLTNGEGCVQLLRSDEDRGAMLLERLGPSMAALEVPFEERLEILTATAQRVWRPVPAAVSLPSGQEKATKLARFIERTNRELGEPFSATAMAHGATCAARRAAASDIERAVLVHGDIHQWNALQASDGSFKLVDPDGLLCEPEYDLGILMREDPEELMAGDPYDRARLLGQRTGLDAEAIWEWGVIERISTALVCLQIGLQPVGDQMLAAAEAIAASA